MRRRNQIHEQFLLATRYFQVAKLPPGHYAGDGHNHGSEQVSHKKHSLPAGHHPGDGHNHGETAGRTSKNSSLPSGHFVGDGHDHGKTGKSAGHSAEAHKAEKGERAHADSHHAHHSEKGGVKGGHHDHYAGCCGQGSRTAKDLNLKLPVREQPLSGANIAYSQKTSQSAQADPKKPVGEEPSQKNPGSERKEQKSGGENKFTSLLHPNGKETSGFYRLFQGDFRSSSASPQEGKNAEGLNDSAQLKQSDQPNKKESSQKEVLAHQGNPETLRTPKQSSLPSDFLSSRSAQKSGGELAKMIFSSLAGKVSNPELARGLKSPEIQSAFAAILEKGIPSEMLGELKKGLAFLKQGKSFIHPEGGKFLSFMIAQAMKNARLQNQHDLLVQLATLMVLIQEEEEERENEIEEELESLVLYDLENKNQKHWKDSSSSNHVFFIKEKFDS